MDPFFAPITYNALTSSVIVTTYLGEHTDTSLYSRRATSFPESSEQTAAPSLLASVSFHLSPLPQQTWGIHYLSPSPLCFSLRWFINRVPISISKDTMAGGSRGRERDRGDKKMLKDEGRSRQNSFWMELRCHSTCVLIWGITVARCFEVQAVTSN